MDRNLKHRRENSAIREGLKTEEEKSYEPMKHNDRSNRILFVTHFNVFLYAACFFIQTGTLPYLTKKFGADPVTFGKLQTAFSVCQLVGGPLYGRIGDIFGEKVAIILALLSTTLTYLFTGLSYNMTTLFFSRLFSVMMHVMQGSQMVATTLSNDKNRAGALARLGFSYGLGMVVGPTLGGVVTKNFGEQAAALLAASGAFLSLVLVVVFVPNIKKERKQQDKGIMDLKKMGGLVCLPAVRGILLIKAICGIPISILQSMFSVIAMEEFGLLPDQNGYLMSYIGVLALVMQGFGVSMISSRASDLTIVKMSAVCLAISYYALSLLGGLWHFLILLVPLTFSLSLINSVISSALTKGVSSTDTGTMLGINMAVNSMIRTVSPTVGGWMMEAYGFKSIGLLGAACNALVVALVGSLQI